jgi:hypothetical protein
MQYKGEDLDLRVPHTRQGREAYGASDIESGNGRWSRYGQPAAGHGDTIWVDDVVLSCCNYAFDVAQANGSAEVGLEHLINALTRVDAAARILEARGIREGQLRRESAALIASEVPAIAAGEATMPRRSAEFEDVIRRAAEAAARRGVSATVDDILWSLLAHGRDSAAIQLLRRLAPTNWPRPEWPRSDWPRMREMPISDPAPPSPIPQPVAQTRPIPTPMPMPPYDVLTSRIGVIEEGMRALHAELASERKQLADLIRDAQRDIVAQRGDSAGLRGELNQRLDGLERTLAARTEASRLPVQIVDRIQALEKAVHGGLGEGARNWAALAQRLQGFETALQSFSLPETPPAIDPDLVERIGRIERLVEATAGNGAQSWTRLGERISHIERLVETAAGEGGRTWERLSERLGDIETLVKRTPAAHVLDVDTVGARLNGLETAVRAGFGETLQAGNQITERLASVERSVSRYEPATPDDTTMLLLESRFDQLDSALEARDRDLIAFSSEIADRLKTVETRSSTAPTAAIDAQTLAAPIRSELLAIAERLEARSGSDVSGSLSELRSRLSALEETTRLVTTSLSAGAEAEVKSAVELRQLGDLISRLGDAHATLTSAVAEWRSETQSAFGTVNARIDAVALAPSSHPPPAAAPDRRVTVPVVDRDDGVDFRPATASTLGAPDGVDVRDRQGDAAVPAEQPQRRRGLWWWLFGTDSITRSNRESELQWERMHQRMRDARERRRREV